MFPASVSATTRLEHRALPLKTSTFGVSTCVRAVIYPRSFGRFPRSVLGRLPRTMVRTITRFRPGAEGLRRLTEPVTGLHWWPKLQNPWLQLRCVGPSGSQLELCVTSTENLIGRELYTPAHKTHAVQQRLVSANQ